ncbi:MAG: PBP1A family penicillin-binding protein [Spirochaetota bacterium]
MFKKYKGFSSKKKTQDTNEGAQKPLIEPIDKPIESDPIIKNNLKWPSFKSETESNGEQNKSTKIFTVKKSFSFPDITKSSFDFSSFLKKIPQFFKEKVHSHRPVLLGVLIGLVLAVFFIFITAIITDFRKVRALADFQPNITTNIYDKNGLLVSELFKQKREIVALSKIPPHLINAFIAIEDNEFYDHFGINVKGIARAFFVNLFSGKIKQGGSTITQQLAKILLTTRERNIFRKIKEAAISIMIEIIYTKKEILGLYLNQIFLGHGVYGVESAAKFYFNKDVWDLDLAESALLATLPSAPNKLSPIRHTERSIERHRVVLAKMVDCGFTTIPEAEKSYLAFWPEYLEYINELPPSITSWSSKVDKAPWFTEYLRRKLVKQFGEEAVYRDGLAVYTTLDLKKQLAAEKYMKEALGKQATVSSGLSFKNEDYIIENFSEMTELFALLHDVNPYYKKGSLEVKQVNDYFRTEVLDELDSLGFLFGNNYVADTVTSYREKQTGYKKSEKVQGCLISIDQRNGYIEAMIGGAEFSSINQLNRVMQSKRQAGSSIKGLLYAAAIESKKFTPATAILDSPYISLDKEGTDWIPDNYDERYYGLVRLRRALELSINVISIRIAEELGWDTVFEYYTKLLKFDKKEAKERIPRDLTVAIGTLDVSPFELARAYAIIANGGRDVIPYSIRYIKNRNGEIIDNTEEETQANLKKEAEAGALQIIKPQTAQIMISMLRSVMTSGTGLSAAMGRPAGGKTGTTSNWRDAWFVGFTPQLTTCIWAGYDNPGLSLGHGQTGGGVVAPIWREYMKDALENEPYLEFPYYGAVIAQKVCAMSGKLPSPYCKQTIDEIFMEDTLPEEECTFCKDLKFNINPFKTAPKENIAGSQHDSIIENIQEKSGSSALDKVGKDLLD